MLFTLKNEAAAFSFVIISFFIYKKVNKQPSTKKYCLHFFLCCFNLIYRFFLRMTSYIE